MFEWTMFLQRAINQQYKPVESYGESRDIKKSHDYTEEEELALANTALQNARALHRISLVFFVSSCVIILLAATQPWLPKPHKIWHQPEPNSVFPPLPAPTSTTIDAKLLILPSTPGSLYRSQGPEADAAWATISSTDPIPISRADVIAAGKDLRKAAKFNESFGLGEKMYAGRLDVLHQVHCLNRLRKEIYKDDDGDWGRGEKEKLHLSHCIWYLLQNIMCTANYDVYTHIWTDTFDYPYPDFNIQKKCTNFDEIVKYQEQHSIDQRSFEGMRKPEEYGPPAKMVRKFKEIHGWFETHEDDGSEGDVIG
ncbi:hypothetical protein HII31_03805 [Pseudocercospora fuligena]|uniref:Tat pathway signal sequence n=1 Tax=Pseudocercospora fuligena TaxID=685502 RepID=A0A8H6VKB7_9PEZI|nr:hypothetical protein HII31_03805 [Pseudocercospora fuligena]